MHAAPAAALLAVALAAAAPATTHANGSGIDVEFAALDGLMLYATYYSSNRPGPGVLMLHQCNRDRRSWDLAARTLADAGFHVLTMDFRGFGQSVDDDVRSFDEQGQELWPMFESDVDRAFEFLLAMPDVDTTRIGAIGASCGGTQALLLAEREKRVKSLVFLSSSLPWISDDELLQFEAGRTLPILGIAAVDDSRTAQRTRAVFDRSLSADSHLMLYKGDAHGVPLFDLDPSLVKKIAGFFAQTL